MHVYFHKSLKEMVAAAPWGRSALPSSAGLAADPALLIRFCWSGSVQQSVSLPLTLSCCSPQVRFSGHSLGSWFSLIVNPAGPQLDRSRHQETQSHLTDLNKHPDEQRGDLDADYFQFEAQIIFKSQLIEITAVTAAMIRLKVICLLSFVV